MRNIQPVGEVGVDVRVPKGVPGIMPRGEVKTRNVAVRELRNLDIRVPSGPVAVPKAESRQMRARTKVEYVKENIAR